MLKFRQAKAEDAEEAEVEWFYEDLQDLLELTPKKDVRHNWVTNTHTHTHTHAVKRYLFSSLTCFSTSYLFLLFFFFKLNLYWEVI